jgi:hypothetical protein
MKIMIDINRDFPIEGSNHGRASVSEISLRMFKIEGELNSLRKERHDLLVEELLVRTGDFTMPCEESEPSATSRWLVDIDRIFAEDPEEDCWAFHGHPGDWLVCGVPYSGERHTEFIVEDACFDEWNDEGCVYFDHWGSKVLVMTRRFGRWRDWIASHCNHKAFPGLVLIPAWKTDEARKALPNVRFTAHCPETNSFVTFPRPWDDPDCCPDHEPTVISKLAALWEKHGVWEQEIPSENLL